jgi:hypothetical protein
MSTPPGGGALAGEMTRIKDCSAGLGCFEERLGMGMSGHEQARARPTANCDVGISWEVGIILIAVREKVLFIDRTAGTLSRLMHERAYLRRGSSSTKHSSHPFLLQKVPTTASWA